MNNFDCLVAVLEDHRMGRQWNPEDVAHDALDQLGLDPQGEAAKPKPRVDPNAPTEETVALAEQEALAAKEKADRLRAQLNAVLEAQRPKLPAETQEELDAKTAAQQEGEQKQSGKAAADAAGDDHDTEHGHKPRKPFRG